MQVLIKKQSDPCNSSPPPGPIPPIVLSCVFLRHTVKWIRPLYSPLCPSLYSYCLAAEP